MRTCLFRVGCDGEADFVRLLFVRRTHKLHVDVSLRADGAVQVARRREDDGDLVMHFRWVEVGVCLPHELVFRVALAEPHFDVVLVDLVAQQNDPLSADARRRVRTQL